MGFVNAAGVDRAVQVVVVENARQPVLEVVREPVPALVENQVAIGVAEHPRVGDQIVMRALVAPEGAAAALPPETHAASL